MKSLKKSDAVKELFQNQAVIHGDIWMYFTETTKDVIKYCLEKKLHIKGLEAFKLSGSGIQPFQNNSIWFNINNGNWDEALSFVSKSENEEFLYEIWYDGY